MICKNHVEKLRLFTNQVINMALLTVCSASSVSPKCTHAFSYFQRYGLPKVTKLNGKKSRSMNTEFRGDCWKSGWRVYKISTERFLYLKFESLHEITSASLIILTFWMLRLGRIYLT